MDSKVIKHHCRTWFTGPTEFVILFSSPVIIRFWNSLIVQLFISPTKRKKNLSMLQY